MPYSVKGFFEINEDMVQILLMLEVLFTQDSKVEDLFCGASSGSEPSLFFSNYFFSLGFQPIQDDFQHDFARMTDEADAVWDKPSSSNSGKSQKITTCNFKDARTHKKTELVSIANDETVNNLNLFCG